MIPQWTRKRTPNAITGITMNRLMQTLHPQDSAVLQCGRLRRDILLALLLLVVSLSFGCSIKIRKRQPTTSAAPKGDISASVNQVRLRMRSLVDPFAGEIERSADQIAASSQDVAVKRAAIRWKIEGVPALRGALFQPDPYTAVLDTWVLTYQMADYFETGPGRAALGAASPVAVQTCRSMEEEFGKVVATFTVSRDVSQIRAYARQWASDHPIRYAIQDRESTLSRELERDVPPEFNLGETVAEITTTADDVHREIQIYSAHLFRQARWEAELLKLDLGGSEVLPMAERAVKSSEQAVATLDRLAPAIKSAADTASNVPTIVASERKAAVDSINDQLTKTLIFIHEERLAVLEQVDDELLTVLKHISQERVAAMQQVSEERIAALQQLHEERIASMDELRDIADSQRKEISRDIELTGVRLVDHAVWRFAQLMAALFVCLLAAGMLFLFVIRRLFFSPGEPDQLLRRHRTAA